MKALFTQSARFAAHSARLPVLSHYLAATDCLEKINDFRKGLLESASDYKQVDGVSGESDTQQDLSTFLTSKTCEGLQSGTFERIVSSLKGNLGMFVVILLWPSY